MLFKQFFMIERLFFIGVRAGAGVKTELEPVKNGAGAGQKWSWSRSKTDRLRNTCLKGTGMAVYIL